jgi:hypothetical protein
LRQILLGFIYSDFWEPNGARRFWKKIDEGELNTDKRLLQWQADQVALPDYGADAS